MRTRFTRILVLMLVLVLCALPAGASAPEEARATLAVAPPGPPSYRSPDGHSAGGASGPAAASIPARPNRPVMRLASAPSAAPQSEVAPCGAGNCTTATSIACNSVAAITPSTDQWDSYSCLDTSLIASLPYSEALLHHTVGAASQDIALAVPEGSLTSLGNWFAPILNSCNSDNCASGGHTTDWATWEHALVSDAPLQEYQLVVESPSVNTFTADALLSCGTHNTGWCEAQVRQTIAPGTYTVISDTTATGTCGVIQYDGWDYAFDGNEVVYKLVLSRPAFVSVTLEYAGNESIEYNNYMAAHILTGDCNQHEEWMSTYLLGESGYVWAWVWDMLPEGTYYIVVDGMYMPCGGDAFRLIVTAQDRYRWLPVLREPPGT